MTETVTFPHGDTPLAGTLYRPDPQRWPGPVPGVVAASGFGGVKEMLLPTFAAALRDAGVATLIFDYAGFGASGGEPRQHVDPAAQVDQCSTALGVLAADPGVDAGRLGVWGPSLAGGHALLLAATDERVRAAVALIPFVTADAAPADPDLLTAIVDDLEARRAGAAPGTVPAVGRPGDLAVMSSDGAWEWAAGMTASAPAFRNEVTLASLVELASYRPAALAARIAVPVRVILATEDRITPAAAVRAALADAAGIDIVEFGDTHFELFGAHLGEVVALTVDWLVTNL